MMTQKLLHRLRAVERLMAPAESRIEFQIVFVNPEDGSREIKLLSELHREAAEMAERKKSAEATLDGAEAVDDFQSSPAAIPPEKGD